MYVTEFEVLRRLLFAALIGAVFGRERRHRKKPIGARTHILIALAACTVAIISSYGFVELALAYPDPRVNLRSDPARLMVGMLTGIGFIGAGIIYKSPHGDIKGITTASEVYLVAVLGIAAGLGLYTLAASTAAIAFLVLIASEFQPGRLVSFLRHPVSSLRRFAGRPGALDDRDGEEAQAHEDAEAIRDSAGEYFPRFIDRK